LEVKRATESSTLSARAYRHLNLSRGSLRLSDEESDSCLRRRDLIEATKTFRGYKSPRDDKIGAVSRPARRAERHAACRARTHARGILMGTSSRATPRARPLDRPLAHFVFPRASRMRALIRADTRESLAPDHYRNCDNPSNRTHRSTLFKSGTTRPGRKVGLDTCQCKGIKERKRKNAAPSSVMM